MDEKDHKYSVTEVEFYKRAKDLGREHHKFVFGVAKAISVSAATVVFFNLIIDFGNSERTFITILQFFYKIVLFVTSWIAVAVTYDGVIAGTLFLYHIPRRSETVLTFLLAGFEFLLFAVLFPNFFLENKEVPTFFNIDISNLWFVFFGFYSFFAHGIIVNAMRNIQVGSFAGTKLKKIVSSYKDSSKHEKNSSLIISLISWSFFILLCLLSSCSFIIVLKLAFGFVVLCIIYIAFHHQHKERKKVEEFLKDQN